MLLSATSRKTQPDNDLQTVQNPEYALLSNMYKRPARCWLTCCSKTSMLLSAISRKGQSDADLQSVWNPEHALVSNKREWLARCWLTYYSKPTACFCQKQVRKASQMLTYNLFKPKHGFDQQQAEKAYQVITYILFKTQWMPLSARSMNR